MKKHELWSHSIDEQTRITQYISKWKLMGLNSTSFFYSLPIYTNVIWLTRMLQINQRQSRLHKLIFPLKFTRLWIMAKTYNDNFFLLSPTLHNLFRHTIIKTWQSLRNIIDFLNKTNSMRRTFLFSRCIPVLNLPLKFMTFHLVVAVDSCCFCWTCAPTQPVSLIVACNRRWHKAPWKYILHTFPFLLASIEYSNRVK